MIETVLRSSCSLCMAYLVLTTSCIRVRWPSARSRTPRAGTRARARTTRRWRRPASRSRSASSSPRTTRRRSSSRPSASLPRVRLSRVRGDRRQRRLDATRRSSGCARRSSSSRTRSFVRHVFPTRGRCARIYRSALTRTSSSSTRRTAGKADALNAALNVARYRYVCGVDADTVFDRRALLKVMRLVSRILPGSSASRASSRPHGTPSGRWRRRPGGGASTGRPLDAFQHLDFVRAFFNNRLAWSRLGFMLCSPGAFQIWRRDVLEEVGGYSRRTSPARTSS